MTLGVGLAEKAGADGVVTTSRTRPMRSRSRNSESETVLTSPGLIVVRMSGTELTPVQRESYGFHPAYVLERDSLQRAHSARLDGSSRKQIGRASCRERVCRYV